MLKRFVFFLAWFTIATLALQGFKSHEDMGTILSVASFVFGIFVAFYTATSHTRFSEITELLQQDNGLSLSVYHMSNAFGNDTKQKIRQLLSEYYMAEIDYFLTDYRMSNDTFMALLQYVYKLEPQNEQQSVMYQAMVECLNDNLRNRKSVESLVRARISAFEWLVLITLLAVMLYSFFCMYTGSGLLAGISIIISTMLVMVLYILYDLDVLNWQYNTRIWRPLQDTIIEFGELPYYPNNVILEKKVIPDIGKVRVVFYPHQYPDMSGKIIKAVNVGSGSNHLEEIRKYKRELNA